MAVNFLCNDANFHQACNRRTSLRCNGIAKNRQLPLSDLPIDFGKTGAQ